LLGLVRRRQLGWALWLFGDGLLVLARLPYKMRLGGQGMPLEEQALPPKQRLAQPLVQ
jgi:hypothetical protein